MDGEAEHLDPTAEINLETVKSRAIKGIVTLTGRTAILNVISLISQGLLWAFLDPSQFGVFLVVSATVNFLSYFADIGLGAALVQKKETPTNKDLNTVFTIQELLVLSVSILLVLVSPVLVRAHSLSAEGQGLLYALTFAFFLASLKNIPSILLERKLEFGKFVVPQIVEQVVYNISVVFFAWKGFGITSFTYSVIIRGIIGVVAIYLIKPWVPRIGISKSSLKHLLTFGVPYQLNNFLATLKDDGLTIVIGTILGPASLGILGTAQKLAQYPLRFFLDNVTKVTFPAFSRMQDDKHKLESSLTRSVFFITFLVFPALVGLVVLFPSLIVAIPKYQKWAPAAIPLTFLSINALMASFTTQLTNFLNAVGKIKTTFKLMIMWTVLTWLFVPVFSKMYGVNGAGLAYGLVGLSSFVALIIVHKIVNFSIKESIIIPAIASSVMGLTIFLARLVHPADNLPVLTFYIVIGGVVYFISTYLIMGSKLIVDMRTGINLIIKRNS